MSLISIKVIPRAKTNEVIERNGQPVVRVTAAPTDGQANAAVLRALAKLFSVPVTRLSIRRGATGRQKTIALDHPSTPPEVRRGKKSAS